MGKLQDLSLLNKEQHLAELRPEGQELDKFITDFSKRESLGTRFIPGMEFINQEISDISAALENHRVMQIDVHITPFHTARPFNHSFCATKVFESLTRGHNLTVGQVIAAAKAACEDSNRKIVAQYGTPIVKVIIDSGFEEICMDWIKTGICFVYYIQFLYRKKQDHQLTLDQFKTLIINYGDGTFINTGNNSSNQTNIQVNKQPNDDVQNASNNN